MITVTLDLDGPAQGTDRVFGFSGVTNDVPSDGLCPVDQREALFITVFLGHRWLHIHVYAADDEKVRKSRDWQVSCEPGFGWMFDFGTPRNRRNAR